MTRLLARENLSVEFGLFDTAYFIPSERKVILPIQYVSLSNDILSLCSAHEVSHALHTPERFFEDAKTLGFPILMILEDCRIENKIKNEFPGLVSIFRRGYASLNEMDFFGINKNEIDPNSLSFVDRINLVAKAPSVFSSVISFTPKEQDFFDRLNGTDRYMDMLKLAIEYNAEFKGKDDLVNETLNDKIASEDGNKNDFGNGPSITSFMPPPEAGFDRGEKEEDEESENEASDSNDEEGLKNSEKGKLLDDDDDDDDDEAGSLNDGDDDEEPSDTSEDVFIKNSDDKPDEESDDGSTLNAEKDFLKQLMDEANKELFGDNDFNNPYLDKRTLEQTSIFEMPSPKDAEQWVIPYTDIIASRENLKPSALNEKEQKIRKKILDDVKKNAAIMAMEFEQKKAAFRNSRSKIANTGNLDMNRLVHYRHTEDIFKKVHILPDGKNHGLIIFIDYSGSMARIINGVLQQLLTFIDFCKRVQIPFEVYAFSNNRYNDFWNARDPEYKEKLKKYSSYRHQLHMFSSKMTPAQYKKAFDQVSCLAADFDAITNRIGLKYDKLSGTPLLETVIDAFPLTEKFIKSNQNVQKVSTIFLTDGEPSSSPDLPRIVKIGNKMYVNQGTDEQSLYGWSPRGGLYDTGTFLKSMYEKHFGIELTNIFLQRPGFYLPRQLVARTNFNNDVLFKNGIEEVDCTVEKHQNNQWSKRFVVVVSNINNRGIVKTSSNKSISGDSVDDLQDSFVSSGMSRKRDTNIFRKLGEYVS